LLFDVADDVRYSATRRAARHLADARIVPRPATPAARAQAMGDFFG